jgi:hypothetical protein
VAIFGRRTARQRLRRAARESLTVPAFSSPIDCTPWVIGGLWPAELSTIDAVNATLAEYLKVDLDRIASSANDELKIIRRAGMADSARKAEEARVIDDARASALRRVESAVRHLRTAKAEIPVAYPRPDRANDFARRDLETTRVLPAVRTATAEVSEFPEPAGEPESDSERLQRLLTFVVRQEPGLTWAVGEREDGTTVVVTDLAHGWIPPGITLPEGVRLLEPERRTGKARALVGDAILAASYAPGDFLGRSTDVAATKSSVQPRQLPAVEDLGWVLGQATRWRDGLPRIVHTLARAATAGTGVIDEEVDLLRVHLDTARYRLLGQYPEVDPALLLNCLLLAATEGIVTGDLIAANYHLAWFQKLSAPPPSQWATTQPGI